MAIIIPKTIAILQQEKKGAVFFLIPTSGLIGGILFQYNTPLTIGFLVTLTVLASLVFFITPAMENIYIFSFSIFQLFFFTGMLLFGTQINQHEKIQKNIPYDTTSFTALVKNKKDVTSSFYKENLILSSDFGNISCYLRNKTEAIPGETIEVNNITLQPQKKSQNNLAREMYSIKENIHMNLFLQKPLSYTVKKQPYRILNKLKRYLFNKRKNLYTSLKNKIPRKTFSYFSSIFLGNKKTSPIKRKKYFYYWGIAHHLARSGLHIALFIILWTFIFSFLPIPLTIKHLLLLLLTTTYMLLSWTSISFLRAFFICILYIIGQIGNKPTNSFYLLFLVALTSLFFNPALIFFLDFQLSFGLTAALILFFQKKGR